jgi:Holliday junction resolvasome RuvABC endonuclease subunit|tara:strand:+ start:58 stop:597 length:540 start_codon:yes stop_codon:yes gene_type:complete
LICAGIDYSTTSPCICIFKKDGTINPIDCNFSFFALDKWRPRWSTLQNVNCYKLPKDLKLIDKYIFLADWTIEALRWHNGRVVKVVLEDYSYGSTGRVFNIAENVGILKFKLKQNGFRYETVPPTVIKKYATGKGNSNKEVMLDAWKAEPNNFELVQEKGNPATDIIDSYYLCKYGVTQ